MSPYRMQWSSQTSILSLITISAVALAALAVFPCSKVRGSEIDRAFMQQGRRIYSKLRDKGITEVGVLRFLIKGDNNEYEFREPLSSVMAVRLENALILANDLEKPIGITRGADDRAALVSAHLKKDTPNWMASDGRKRLFDFRYPLAWGCITIKVKAFVSGYLEIDLPAGKSTFRIIAFDEDGTMWNVSRFDVSSDASVLVDTRESFVLPRQQLRNLKQEKQFADAAVKNANERNKKGAVAQPGDQLVELDVLHGKKKQRAVPHQKKPGELKLQTSSANDQITVRLRNISRQRVGMVLAVGDKSTLDEEKISANDVYLCSKWVLDAGKSLELKGFYANNFKKMTPFSAKTPAQDPSMMLLVFVEKDGKPIERRDAILRTPLPSGVDSPKSLAAARRMLRKVRIVPRSLLIPGTKPTASPEDIKSLSLNNPTLQEVRVIWLQSRRP